MNDRSGSRRAEGHDHGVGLPVCGDELSWHAAGFLEIPCPNRFGPRVVARDGYVKPVDGHIGHVPVFMQPAVVDHHPFRD